MTASCPAGHELAPGQDLCPACRRQAVVDAAAAASALPAPLAAAAVDAVVSGPAALRSLAAALEADPGALTRGAPPLIGRLVTELIARGSVTLPEPACVRCGRAGWPLIAAAGGGTCSRCRRRELAEQCSACGVVKPVAWHDQAGRAVCETCRRRVRGWRRCGICGKTASIARRTRGEQGDVCVNCYQLPRAACSVQRVRPDAAVQLRRQLPPALRGVLASGHSPVRALRSASACFGPVARRAGLRPVLYRVAAPPGTVHGLRRGPAAGVPARPGRHDLRRLRRPAGHPCLL